MSVLVIVDPQISIPPREYGGTERIVHLLCAGLQAQGHTVRLLAGPGSRDYGGGLCVHQAPSLAYLSRAFRKIWFQFLSLWASRGSVDIVVNFGRTDYLIALLRCARLPLICWFENEVFQREINWLLARRPSALKFVGISCSQVEGLETGARLRVIYNAVDTSHLNYNPQPVVPPYIAFLGRLTRNKGVHLAIEAARRTGILLKIAGNIATTEEEGAAYFDQVVRPQLGKDCEWVGPVDDTQKRVFLQGATALLFPVQWKEPFGIVMAESLSCGTPVVAWRIGSTPEVIRDGVSGYLCDSVDAMVVAIKRIQAGEIRREDCRHEAEERFSQPVFISRFLELVAGRV